MLRAMIINKNTIALITELNGGVRPEQECIENKTYFVYSDTDDPNEISVFDTILTDEDFHKMFKFTDTDDNENTIERI